jgi:endonuclease YncB( thermonuclease family)
VEETLLLGQKKIEEAKVQTYWMTGKLINEHITKNDSRSEHYGRQVVEKLAEDIAIDSSTLWRCARFAHSFKKILARGQESLPKTLVWSHYRELIKVEDEEERVGLMKRAAKSGWSAVQLSQKIQQERKDPVAQKEEPVKRSYPKLIPRKGELYTYRLIELDPLHKKYTDALRIDVGFKLHQKLPDAVKNLKAGQIIESMKNEQDEFSVTLSKRKDTSLFTYKAYVERVVDADTLYVDIDLGFKMGILQYLRLRGINSPEIDTVEGKKAKAFVERELAKVPYIVLTSSRSDKYDRYLADIWYGEGDGEKYLNGVLLEEGLAERME